MRMRRLALLCFVILFLVACRPREQASPEPGVATPMEPSLQASPVPEPETSPLPGPGTSPLPQPGESPILPRPPLGLVEAVVTRLAAELAVAPEDVTVVSLEPAEWPDTSLGCPKPGMAYAQVVTPGYRFVLEAAGEQHEVHTDATGQNAVLCP